LICGNEKRSRPHFPGKNASIPWVKGKGGGEDGSVSTVVDTDMGGGKASVIERQWARLWVKRES
jgi:hypothetical protein